MDLTEIDWDALLAEAIDVVKHTYCPYSNFPVGTAGLMADGWLISSCSVENAGYGVTLCTEYGMVSGLIRSGGDALVAAVTVNGNKEPVAPCGRCRQFIYEHDGPSCLVLMPDDVAPMTEVLSGAFGPYGLLNVAQAVLTSLEEKEGHDGSL